MKQLILMRGVNQMNFRKTVSLALAFVLAFAPFAGAASTDIDVCDSCQGKATRLDNLLWESGGTQTACEPISYEYQEYPNGGTAKRWGYMADSQDMNAKLIVRLCNCRDTSQTYFNSGRIIGIRLSIQTPGVYWTDEPLVVQPFASQNAACNGVVGRPGGVAVSSTDGINGPADAITDPAVLAGTPALTALPNVVYGTNGNILGILRADGTVNTSSTNPNYRTFLPPIRIEGVIPSEGYDATYAYRYSGGWIAEDQAYTPTVTGQGTRTTQNVKYDYYKDLGMTELANPMSPTTSVANCEVAAAARARVLQVKGAYQFGPLDEYYELAYWWLDLPQMVKDHRYVQRGDVQIKVELLSADAAGVCALCKTICECVFTIGTFPEETVSTTTMYFPYVLTGFNPWISGIVVTNLDTVDTPIADMEATFTVTDSTGDTFTYTKKDFESEGGAVYSFVLDNILDRFAGGTPKAGNAWLKVETNFSVDGYEFVTDNQFGAGTLPRK